MPLHKIDALPTFDILMATHAADDINYLKSALLSLESEINNYGKIILVADGPLDAAMMQLINDLSDLLRIEIIQLEKSLGLGEALNRGISHSNADYLVRMDSDDLTNPGRLEKIRQYIVTNGPIDVVGSFIEEFHADPIELGRLRKVPTAHDEISQQMRFRCVMNHVTCAISREALLAVGGYQGGRGFPEDWWLWARMLMDNRKFANIPLILVRVRLGSNFLDRRRGGTLFLNDLKFAKLNYKIGFFKLWHLPSYVCVKLFQRFCPTWILDKTYSFLRENRDDDRKL